MRTGLLSGKMGPAWDWRCEIGSEITGAVAVSEYPAPGAEPLVYQYPDRSTALTRAILFHT